MTPPTNCPNGNAPLTFDDNGPRLNVYCRCGCGLSVWALRPHVVAAWNRAVGAIDRPAGQRTAAEEVAP